MGACPHQLDHPQGTLVCPDPLRGIWQGHWDEAPEGQYTMSGCPHFHSIKGGSPANPQGLLIGLQSWPRHKPQAPLPCSVTWSKVRVQGRRLPQGGTGPTWESEPRWDIKHRVWVQLQGLRQTLLPSRPPSVLCPETGWSPRTPQQPQAEGGRRQASPKDSVVSRTPLRGCGHLAPGSSLSRTGCVLGKSWVHVYNEGVVSPA